MKFLLTKVPSIVSGDKLFLFLLLFWLVPFGARVNVRELGHMDCPGYCQGVNRAFESATHVTLVVTVSVS